jgi:hypothetical protein
MKTQSIELFPQIRRDERIMPFALPRLKPVAGLTARVLMALVPALVLVVGTAWLVTAPNLVIYLQAATWAAGFIFLALAVESERPDTALLMALTGVALPMLAFLSSRLAVELAIVSSMLVAIWVAAALLRR